MLVGFVVWQALNPKEPLLPLELFKDRNFSLANVAIATVGFAVTAMSLPLMLLLPGRPRADADPVGADAGADGRG